jgi:probable rRNA maturation factor
VSGDPPRPTVLLDDRQELRVDPDGLVELARRTLEAEDVPSGELSVSLVTSEEMERLHEEYLGETGPTDVLSFPQDDLQRSAPGEGLLILGDVVICPEVAGRQNPDLEAEVRLLLVHGILHLLGYDHETEDDRTEMWRRQDGYVAEAVR